MARLELERNPITISSWVIYDMANSMFSAGVVGLVFPLWVISHSGGGGATVGYTWPLLWHSFFPFTISWIFVWQTQKKNAVSLSVNAVLDSKYSVDRDMGTKTVTFTCRYSSSFIQLANIFYNGLLGDLSTNGNAGLIVGIGVGLGYIGAITSSCYVNFTFGGWRPCKSFSTDGFLFTGFYCTVTCCRQISD